LKKRQLFFGCFLVLFTHFESLALTISANFKNDTVVNIPNKAVLNTSFYKTDSIFSFKSPKGYFPSLISNFGQQVVSPFHLNKKQLVFTGIGLAITASLIVVDGEIDDWAKVQKQKHNWINKSSPIVTELGGNYGLYSIGALGLISAVSNNQKGVQTSLLASQAVLTSGVWMQIIKHLTGRERPFADYANSKSEAGRWHGPFVQYDQDSPFHQNPSSFDSFASGHTATAFSIATVFATRYKNIKAIPIISYSLASLVGITRLTEHEHWASDVFVGAVFGYLCGKQVLKKFDKPFTNCKNNKLVNLAFTQKGNQMGITYKW
jgi:membrane-associated phospholipid phosphatase